MPSYTRELGCARKEDSESSEESEEPPKEGNPHYTPPITLVRGPVSRGVSPLSTEPRSRDSFLKGLEYVLQDEIRLVDLFLSHGVLDSHIEATHLIEHWFDDKNGWWPYQKVERKLAEGLRDAFQKSQDTGLPVECYWLIYDPYPGFEDKHNAVFTRMSHCGKDAALQAIMFTICTPALPHWQSHLA